MKPSKVQKYRAKLQWVSEAFVGCLGFSLPLLCLDRKQRKGKKRREEGNVSNVII